MTSFSDRWTLGPSPRFFWSRLVRTNPTPLMFENRAGTIELIRKFSIPQAMIARACEIRVQRVSDFVRGGTLSTALEERIAGTVKAISFVWGTFKPFRIELGAPELLEAAVENARNEQARRLSQDLKDLQKQVLEGFHVMS